MQADRRTPVRHRRGEQKCRPQRLIGLADQYNGCDGDGRGDDPDCGANRTGYGSAEVIARGDQKRACTDRHHMRGQHRRGRRRCGRRVAVPDDAEN